jgi:hypothetical protein
MSSYFEKLKKEKEAVFVKKIEKLKKEKEAVFVKKIEKLETIEKDKVFLLEENGKVRLSLARKLIEESVYWDHPKYNDLVRAPSHQNHISDFYPWKIKFGSNTFCISQSVLACQSILIEFLNTEKRDIVTMKELYEKLTLKISNSVENGQGRQYSYPISVYRHHEYLEFGVNLLCISDFINCLAKECQTFKITRTNHLVCPYCQKRFNHKRDLDYHYNVYHYV